ncbi:hypothetical protein [Xanthobacter versatilis]|uniref:hypothetical protein n=1 Tax=Xanthobacter autotrophicus (strain ATCC BAA-1158 / Py2) TaxID=78245 RepID=UPI0037299BBB
MKIREALKADFGIDVLIMGGSGLSTDPFVVEPCSAADATRTQLNLLRGLGRGRCELWRLLSAERGFEVTSSIQCLRIETVSFSQDTIIVEKRSYCFDVSQVQGVPATNVLLIEWGDPRTTFYAPSQIGWLHFDGAINNSQTNEDLDISLLYSALGIKGTIYVCDAVFQSTSQTSLEKMRQEQLQLMCNQIHVLHPNAEAPWPIRLAGPFVLKYFLVGDDLAVAGVAILGRCCLKIRLTCFDDLRMRDLMNQTIQDLGRLVREAGIVRQQ